MAGKWVHKTLRNVNILYFCSGVNYNVDADGKLSPDPVEADAVMLKRSPGWTFVADKQTPKQPPKKATPAPTTPAKTSAKKSSRGTSSKKPASKTTSSKLSAKKKKKK